MKNLCYQFKKTGICQCAQGYVFLHSDYTFPHVLILHHIYPNPDYFYLLLGEPESQISNNLKTSLFDAFYYDLFLECSQFGLIQNIIVSRNVNASIAGTAWIFYDSPDCAITAQKAMNNRFHAGRKILATLWDSHKLTTILCDPPN
ncbi:U2 snrnp auxiliary factor, small subunit [Tritrichomonas foetus]|uniref:U2 snrnp auxiliary factor, small subunit n=1 Tax=Tritrichomonas foetus TaxID=1144522 RepID=A0A1J4K4S6_9EUKA|nr:U2 snrnp auxiliary factor, small subunit [Tritrichomonas foetus]|eukprot:OHT04686.1 U2 snrnp auxiliary factor, small subunit [Tritrichomonas foetus]